MNTYKELIVWQKAMLLTKEVYQIAKLLPRDETYALSLQLRRAAASVPSNIAEGYSRISTKEYVQFLGVARGSAAETETQLLIANQNGLIKSDETDKALALCEEIIKMLTGMITKLS